MLLLLRCSDSFILKGMFLFLIFLYIKFILLQLNQPYLELDSFPKRVFNPDACFLFVSSFFPLDSRISQAIRSYIEIKINQSAKLSCIITQTPSFKILSNSFMNVKEGKNFRFQMNRNYSLHGNMNSTFSMETFFTILLELGYS